MAFRVIIFLCLLWTFVSASDENGMEDNLGSQAEETKIIGGEEVEPGQFPYQVFIEKIWNSTLIYKCGGVIYNAQFVLTAAHCLYFKDREEFASPRKIWVTAGTHDLISKDPQIRKFEQVIHGKEIFPHPKFQFKKTKADGQQKNNYPLYDIGLIKLDKPFEFTERVQPMPIANSNFIEQGNGTVTGFGRPKADGRWTKRMRHVDIPIINWKNCSKLFREAAIINEEMFCTGVTNGQVTPCNGDSGGPIVCNSNGMRVLCGISSFGAKNCSNYSVYTRVASYFHWIQSTAGDQGLI